MVQEARERRHAKQREGLEVVPLAWRGSAGSQQAACVYCDCVNACLRTTASRQTALRRCVAPPQQLNHRSAVGDKARGSALLQAGSECALA